MAVTSVVTVFVVRMSRGGQVARERLGEPFAGILVTDRSSAYNCRAADGTTPAARFFRRAFPDLFETVLPHIEDMPRPRRRNQAMTLTDYGVSL